MVVSALLCLLVLCTDEFTGPFDRFPYLQALTTRSVLIVAQTGESVRAELRYGRDSTTPIHIGEDEPGHDHVFRLEDLAPDTRYYYRLVPFHEDGVPPSSFRTLPDPGHSLEVAVIGDSGNADSGRPVEAQLAVLPNMLRHIARARPAYSDEMRLTHRKPTNP